MNIQFKRLSEIEKSEIIDLMNNSLVRRQMPLLKDKFTEDICEKFVTAKEQLWADYGYGPWAFVINNRFAGWGGLQPENGEADLGLVLHPDFWGVGKSLYREIISRAFGKMGLNSVTVLLPPSRTRIKALLRMGFKKDEELKIDNELFIRYILENPTRLEQKMD